MRERYAADEKTKDISPDNLQVLFATDKTPLFVRDAISDNLLKVSAGGNVCKYLIPHRIFFWVKIGKYLSRQPSDALGLRE